MSSAGSRPSKGAKRPRKSVRTAVSMLSTISSRFLSSRLLVKNAAFCQLASQEAAVLFPREAWMSSNEQELDYAGGGLKQCTSCWGAFVIGLAGTILVSGIAPVMVTSLGAAAIPVTFIITCTGWLLCLFLAELSAMMPERTGGSPSYAYPAYKQRWPRSAEHVNGFTAWAYWLGWFPVAAPNIILASIYIAFAFLLTWNVIAMEAAACYIGECKDPARDAKIALNLEGGYGVFIYTMIPVAFVLVLGVKALGNPALVDPKTIFVRFAGKVFSTGGNVLNWLIAVMLIVALVLS